MNAKTWFEKLTSDSIRSAAAASGLSRSALTRQISDDAIDAGSVIALCRTYGVNPVRALIDLGFLKMSDVQEVCDANSLQSVSNSVLLDEVIGRGLGDDSDTGDVIESSLVSGVYNHGTTPV